MPSSSSSSISSGRSDPPSYTPGSPTLSHPPPSEQSTDSGSSTPARSTTVVNYITNIYSSRESVLNLLRSADSSQTSLLPLYNEIEAEPPSYGSIEREHTLRILHGSDQIQAESPSMTFIGSVGAISFVGLWYNIIDDMMSNRRRVPDNHNRVPNNDSTHEIETRSGMSLAPRLHQTVMVPRLLLSVLAFSVVAWMVLRVNRRYRHIDRFLGRIWEAFWSAINILRTNRGVWR